MKKIKRDSPAMHTVVRTMIGDEAHALVVHRDLDGTVLHFHSPLTKSIINCSLCESGVRVYFV